MEKFVPSEIARLILGYLDDVKCTRSWQVFLEESIDLQEYCRLYKQGEFIPTKIQGESLLDILKVYCVLKSFFEQIICQCSWKVLEDITYLQEHYSLYKQRTRPAQSGQTVINALQEWVSKNIVKDNSHLEDDSNKNKDKSLDTQDKAESNYITPFNRTSIENENDSSKTYRSNSNEEDNFTSAVQLVNIIDNDSNSTRCISNEIIENGTSETDSLKSFTKNPNKDNLASDVSPASVVGKYLNSARCIVDEIIENRTVSDTPQTNYVDPSDVPGSSEFNKLVDPSETELVSNSNEDPNLSENLPNKTASTTEQNKDNAVNNNLLEDKETGTNFQTELKDKNQLQNVNFDFQISIQSHDLQNVNTSTTDLAGPLNILSQVASIVQSQNISVENQSTVKSQVYPVVSSSSEVNRHVNGNETELVNNNKDPNLCENLPNKIVSTSEKSEYITINNKSSEGIGIASEAELKDKNQLQNANFYSQNSVQSHNPQNVNPSTLDLAEPVNLTFQVANATQPQNTSIVPQSTVDSQVYPNTSALSTNSTEVMLLPPQMSFQPNAFLKMTAYVMPSLTPEGKVQNNLYQIVTNPPLAINSPNRVCVPLPTVPSTDISSQKNVTPGFPLPTIPSTDITRQKIVTPGLPLPTISNTDISSQKTVTLAPTKHLANTHTHPVNTENIPAPSIKKSAERKKLNTKDSFEDKNSDQQNMSSTAMRNVRKKRPPKRKPLRLFSPHSVKSSAMQKTIQKKYSNPDIPVLSIPESPLRSIGNSAVKAAYNVASRITNEFKEQSLSPVLKLLMSNASDLMKTRNYLPNASHIRNLNLNLNSAVQEAYLDMPTVSVNNEVTKQDFNIQNSQKMLNSPKRDVTQNRVIKFDAQGRNKTVSENKNKDDSCKQNEKGLAVPDVKNKLKKNKELKKDEKDKSLKKNSKAKNTKRKSPKKSKKLTTSEKKKGKRNESSPSKSTKTKKKGNEIKKSKKESQAADKETLNNRQTLKENMSERNETATSDKKDESFENIHLLDDRNISKKSSEVLVSNKMHESEKGNSEKQDCDKENKSQECDRVQLTSKTKLSNEETISLNKKNNKLPMETEREQRNPKNTRDVCNTKQIIEKKNYLEESMNQVRRSKRIQKSTTAALISNCSKPSNLKEENGFKTNNNHPSTPNKRKMSTPRKWTSTSISYVSGRILPNGAHKIKQLEVPKPLNNLEVATLSGKEPPVKKGIEKIVEHEKGQSNLGNILPVSSNNVSKLVDQDINYISDDIRVIDLCSSEEDGSDSFVKENNLHHVSEKNKIMENNKKKLINLVISFDPGKKSRVIQQSEKLIQMKEIVFSDPDISPEKACECNLQNSSDVQTPDNKSFEKREKFLVQDNSSDSTIPNSTLIKTNVARSSSLDKNFDIVYFSPSKSNKDSQTQPIVYFSETKVLNIEKSNPLGYIGTKTPCKNQNSPVSRTGKRAYSSGNKMGENCVPQINKTSECKKHNALSDKNKIVKTLSARCKHTRFKKSVSETDRTENTLNILSENFNHNASDFKHCKNLKTYSRSPLKSDTSFVSSSVKTGLLDSVENSAEVLNCENFENENKNSACTMKRKLGENVSDIEKTPEKHENLCDFGLPHKKRTCRKLSSSSDEMNDNTPKKISNYTRQEITNSFPPDKDQDLTDNTKEAASSLQAISNSLDITKNLSTNHKRLQDSPVKCTNKVNKINHKSALSKKIEKDPDIPAGVKIPSKWNNSNIIKYSNEIRQSTKAIKKKEKKINSAGIKEKTVVSTKNPVKSAKQKISKQTIQQKTLSKKNVSSDTLPEDLRLHYKPYVSLPKLPGDTVLNHGNKFEQNVEEKVADHSINLAQDHEQTFTTDSSQTDSAEENPNKSSYFSNSSFNLHVHSNNEKTQDFTERDAEKRDEVRNDLPVSKSSFKNESVIQQSKESISSSNDHTVPPEEEVSEETSKLKMFEALIEKFGLDYVCNILNKLGDTQPSEES